jgi:hypothetical protein
LPSRRGQRIKARLQASTFASLKYPLSAGSVPTSPSASGRRRAAPASALRLPLVVGRLRDIGGHDQKAARRDDGLRVVALIKAAARDRHDARLFIAQVDLIGRQRPLRGRPRRLASGLRPVAFVFASRARLRTSTNSASIRRRNRRRNAAIVSWSGCPLAAMKRNETPS